MVNAGSPLFGGWFGDEYCPVALLIIIVSTHLLGPIPLLWRTHLGSRHNGCGVLVGGSGSYFVIAGRNRDVTECALSARQPTLSRFAPTETKCQPEGQS